MYLVHFKKIPGWLNQMIIEFEDSALDFWFWLLAIEKSSDIINFYGKKYANEIKEEIFADAQKIKIEIALLLNEINERTIKQEIGRIRKIINREIADIQIFLKRKELLCEN
ncbi:hypothetical protein KKC83_00085 [Patescibacteria group bacterium]|nr:hypothetical protein [Candidatus Falkowbacteria bacterium]MBU3906073.1 hypothetical protein [Patescibacteria group bacterium]MBU4015149.1 hypothetical protein [Patescibacteria group bacterium]MBU4025939.1 hypothetical protein [Patescibacteria group bacterium]MBU4073121.1 hypothetical protein [Patescibacteria group bacterium]